MLKVGLDGRLLQGKLTGVGKYVLNMLDYICDHSSDINFIIYTNRPLECKLRSGRVEVVQDSNLMAKVKPMVWSKLFMHRLINRNLPDVFLAGDTFVPLLSKCKKVVAVVHDFNAIIAPETMSRLRLITDKLFFKSDIKKASAIICNSFGTADKLKKYYNIDTTLVIHPIMDKQYRLVDPVLVNERLQSRGINYPYILTVSTQEPRKNMDKAIQAFIEAKKSPEMADYKMLLVGSKGWKADHIQQLIQSHKQDVLSLGYVDDELMPYIYSGAKLFVFPSSYEGFGMPAREAMLCGTNVLATDMPELREASYEQAVYINPEDGTAFAEQIVKLSKSGLLFAPGSLKNTDHIESLIGAFLNV
ncbi:glycosyltransferase family 4 protein [Mucilaginibacter sp. Bleaf8]|uniref:glycosyltransferase family 4 protein n=1 Tax=Mucilaginibacter sp. Bleaf8 TaxID=2834430 RepID=UPI001BCD2DA5|nr:glycosyltransferase family 1 protein [Mucilaginibacter sp. Bleaf8]MBS7562855.1 glycosyltransferase family 4 protein [Mucilaginibacter sp. Bleaf8]